MQTFFIFAITFLVGFYASKYFTTPVFRDGKKHPNRLPAIRIWRLEVLPRFGFHTNKSLILLHHWVYLPIVILGALILYDNIMHLTTFKLATGASMGSAIQGLTYPDRFQFKHPRKKIK